MQLKADKIVKKRKFPSLNMSQKNFLKYLHSEYSIRKSKNSKYSIRSFAKYLNVDQSLLTKVMNGERTFSQESIAKCLQRLQASDSVTKAFVRNIPRKKHHYHKIDDDLFQVMSEWYHFAILELLTTKGFILNPESVSNRLGISLEEAQSAIERLLKLQFIELKKGRYSLSRKSNSWFSQEKTSEARKKLQKQLMLKSAESIDSVPFNLREHNSVTLAVKKEFIPEIKLILQEANQKLTVLLQQTEDFDEVYQLTLSFFPLTRVTL